MTLQQHGGTLLDGSITWMTTLSHSQLGKERITLYMNPENTEKKDGESEERKSQM